LREEIACRWLRRAREDLRVASDEEDITWVSVFHSQQAAEKALKAILVALGVQPPRTHSIGYLILLLSKSGVDVAQLLSINAARLTRYAVEARYPDFEEEPSLEEAREALEIAKRVVEWAGEKLREMGVECSVNGG